MAFIDVVSEVTGTVWRVTAQVGQLLAPDDEILVIESMKMEIPVQTEDGGALREILVAEGDMVQEGAVVARLEAGGA